MDELVVKVQEVTFCFASVAVKKQFLINLDSGSFRKINIVSIDLREDGIWDGSFHLQLAEANSKTDS